MSERQESGRAPFSVCGREYPAVVGAVSVTPVAMPETKDLHRDGVLFARSALAQVEALIRGHEDHKDRELRRWVDDDHTDETLRQVFARLKNDIRLHEFERDRLLAGGLVRRPKRQMPSMVKIAAHHGLSDSAPLCVRCGRVPDDCGSWRKPSGLQRAHMIDRVFDGLDTLANLLPLCVLCHRSQPIFKAGDEDKALDWFLGTSTIQQHQTGEKS